MFLIFSFLEVFMHIYFWDVYCYTLGNVLLLLNTRETAAFVAVSLAFRGSTAFGAPLGPALIFF